MVHFVGAGPGAPDLITRRGAALLQEADCIIYAGSLVNPALLGLAKPGCAIYNSAEMTLEQVLDVMRTMEADGKITVRLHTGDPCLYGAIREQMDALDADGIAYDDTPGVSSFCGAAAALNAEYTLPTVSQTVIITRMEGRTPVPEREKLASLAAHGATMVIFLSIGLVDKVQDALLQGGPPGKGDAAAAAAVHTAGQGVCQPPGQCQTGVGKGQIGPGHWSDPLRNSVVKPGSYSLLRSYRVPRKSPATMSAVLVMPASCTLCAREPTVQRTVFCSGQVALYTTAAGVSGV